MRWVLLAFAWVALAGAGEMRPHPTAGPSAPRIHYRLRVLPNGLKVVSVADRSQANVAVQVWYGVGARDDPPGRSGLAHLVEHLMFRGSRDLPADYIGRLTEDAGGDDNASTDSDFTEYDDLAPAGRLPQLLWAEAERMGALTVDEAGFAAERAVVERELEEDVLSDPYGPLFDVAIPKAAFGEGAYGRSPGGSLRDLNAATLREAAAFHAAYYRPDNALLVVVGDFDDARLDAWIDRYFKPMRRPAKPIATPPRQEAPSSVRGGLGIAGADAAEPAVVLCYDAPPAGGRDAAALKVVDALLSGEGVSRLRASLVQRRRLANDVFSDVDLRQRGGELDLGAMLAPGRRIAEVEAALSAEVSDLRTHPVGQFELSTAKSQLRAKLLQDRETIEGLASQIGQAVSVEGGAAHVNTDVQDVRAVSAADVQRVANLYLADDRRVTIRYGSVGRSPPAAADPLSPTRSPAAPKSRPVGLDDRLTPRAMPAAVLAPAASPAAAPVERILSNGLRVIVAPTGALPLATVMIRFRGGSTLDPPGRAGLTALAGSLASQGAGALSPSAAAARLGQSYKAEVDEDSTTLSLTGLSNVRASLAILAQAVRGEALDEATFQAARLRAQRGAAESLQDMDELAELAVARLVFGRGAYGRLPEGTPSSLARITRQDVQRQHERVYRPDQAILVITGDVRPETALRLAQRTFGDWRKPRGPLPAPRIIMSPPRARVVLIDSPGGASATVIVAGRSVGRDDPTRSAAEVANAVLGGGFSSRLNQEIRVRRGLSYDAGSELQPRNGRSLFSATVQAEAGAAPEVAKSILEQLKSLRADAPGAREVAAGKAALIGQALARGRTSFGLAETLAEAGLDGRGSRGASDQVVRLAAVTPAQVAAAALRLCDPGSTNILVIGDKNRVLREMRRDFAGIQVMSLDWVSSRWSR